MCMMAVIAHVRRWRIPQPGMTVCLARESGTAVQISRIARDKHFPFSAMRSIDWLFRLFFFFIVFAVVVFLKLVGFKILLTRHSNNKNFIWLLWDRLRKIYTVIAKAIRVRIQWSHHWPSLGFQTWEFEFKTFAQVKSREKDLSKLLVQVYFYS